MPSPMNPTIKATSLRIQRALSRPGATGMKGFLLWTQAAWPPAIASGILKAASRYTPGAGPAAGSSVPPLYAQPGGGFANFGDDSGITVDLTAIPDSVSSAIADANATPIAPTTAATPSAPASQSWLQDISQAVGVATTAVLGITQAKDAQTIFQTNLARAQQGLPMIPTNPTQYGLPAPTANIGLTSSAQTTLLVLGGLVLAGVVIASLAKGR